MHIGYNNGRIKFPAKLKGKKTLFGYCFISRFLVFPVFFVFKFTVIKI